MISTEHLHTHRNKKTYIESVSDKIHQNVKRLIFFFGHFLASPVFSIMDIISLTTGYIRTLFSKEKKLMLELFTQNRHIQCSVIVRQTQSPCLEGTRSRKARDGGHHGIFITASGFGFNFSCSPGKATVLHFLSHFL